MGAVSVSGWGATARADLGGLLDVAMVTAGPGLASVSGAKVRK